MPHPIPPVPHRVDHLYIHIPFCRAKCPYCAFVTHIGSTKLIEPYVTALATEIQRRADSGITGPLDTVYLGGGTPSMLSPRQIETVLGAARELLGIHSDAEISLEAHPSETTFESLQGYRRLGINRLSFGAETLHARELEAIGRAHSPGQVAEVVDLARRADFDNINLDLMYGLPGQTSSSWRQTLDAALVLAPDHLSLYPLSVEPRTPFARRRDRGVLDVPGDDQVAGMYERAASRLAEAGYEHYEIANWAHPGRRSRHNLAYWRNREWLGVGVGAHGYLLGERTVNVAHTKPYIDRMLGGEDVVVERYRPDAAERAGDEVMLGLRLLTDGLPLAQLFRLPEADAPGGRRGVIDELEGRGLVRMEGDRLFLPEAAAPLANEIVERLIL